VNGGLGQHGVVCLELAAAHKAQERVLLTLELRLPQRRGVSGDDDELGLASSQALEGGLVAEGDLTGLHHKRKARVDGVGISLVLLGGHRCS
jgi:hypothetical protein